MSADERSGASVRLSSRGAAAADLDNDGDLDIVVLNSRMPATVLRNDTPSRDHWLQVRLDGRASNRSAIGARVDVTAGDLRLADEVRSGRGYQSDWGRRLHFGLGPRTMVDRVEVRWPSGNRDVLETSPATGSFTWWKGNRPPPTVDDAVRPTTRLLSPLAIVIFRDSPLYGRDKK